MQHKRLTVQLVCAVIMCAVGAGLIIAAFIVEPRGDIHNSVLIAFGEILSFVGAVFGIDYSYKKRTDDAK